MLFIDLSALDVRGVPVYIRGRPLMADKGHASGKGLRTLPLQHDYPCLPRLALDCF